MELYKQYRPKTLARVAGATQTAAALQAMIDSKSVPHAILFHGPSGCGKTTLARIVREELGCGDFDFKELNSAAFRGIDTIREIQKQMTLAPCGGPCRVWLLDEVHMLSKDAQNAALKMLEDTPSHVYFLLCTTEPQKLIAAVRTRCSDMAVRLLTPDELKGVLTYVNKKEKITISKEVEDELITSAMGSARTLLVLLERVQHLNDDERVKAIADKLADDNEAIDLCRALISKAPWKRVAEILRGLKADAESVRWAVLGYARAVLLSKGDYRSYLIIDEFKHHFYDSKEAGLALACYNVCHAKD